MDAFRGSRWRATGTAGAAGAAAGNGVLGQVLVGFAVCAGTACRLWLLAAGADAAGAGAAAGADCRGDPAPSITATIVCIGTVCPSGTLSLLFSHFPAEGEGISASTLSVEISKQRSSRSTLSPGFFRPLGDGPFKDAFRPSGA